VVAGRSFSKWFDYHAQADNFRSKLLAAARAGEGFDTESGLPESLARRKQALTWFDLATRYVDMKWPHLAAKSRTSIVDALATVTPALVTTTRGMPDAEVLRTALYSWAFHATNRATLGLPDAQVQALTWIQNHSLSVAALDEPDRRSLLIRRALDALALTINGQAAAATTIARKRAVFLRRAELRR
jgi:hypothetical protein